MSDDKISGYPSDISDQLKEMFYNGVAAVKERTTEIKIKAIQERTAKVEKKITSLGKVFRDLFNKGAGDIEKHVLD